jgi:hypothetical protein
LKLLEKISEILGWLYIALALSAIGALAGYAVYYFIPSSLGIVLGVATATVGMVGGILAATRAYKRKGTVHLLTRTMASPELDHPD